MSSEFLGPYQLGPNDTPENGIYTGDARELAKAIPDESVDLIFTDPPYPKEYQHTYQALADESPRILKHGASLMTIVPHYSLPDVIGMFAGRLKYRWTMCMNQFSGKHSRMAMGIEVMWKPILWYVKGSYPQGRGFLRDGIEISGRDGQVKSRHYWEQDAAWAEYYVERLSSEGAAVIDFYCGSGTVPAVCNILGRRYLAFEIDPDTAEMARERVRNTQPPLFVPEPEQIEMEGLNGKTI